MTNAASLSSPPALEFSAHDLVLSRGGRRILENVSLTASAGDIVVLKGPNGVGKTTLLRAFAGLLTPDNGKIFVPEDATVFLSALNASKAAMSVDENLRFWAALYGAADDAIAKARKTFSLDEFASRQAGALSTGLARRLGLARLIISQRPIWFVDEPTAGLDKKSSETFIALVEQHRKSGGISVIATHEELPLKDARMMELA